MSFFYISQMLIVAAIFFDLISFYFKGRGSIVACLFCSGVLVATHFALLEQWTAATLMVLATFRYLTSVFSTSPKLMFWFCGLSILAAAYTYAGLVSILSCSGAIFQTMAAFKKEGERLRQLMMVGAACWILNNYLVHSPAAVAMEILFFVSNLAAYYHDYMRKKPRQSWEQ
ncbi:inner membrane protein [Sinobacterium caligoides]|uniref:Inner membrane protein n=1 Tax=Sinobacterium caligoides TaxID=933926 RepID=A0A3N2DXP3_9GAMM|nr:YgjV family protein [Sinobacterium caligoides]ROS04626.1 inner membrane protein [Sinobacterium caligoides]